MLGTIGRDPDLAVPSRHLGLVPAAERAAIVRLRPVVMTMLSTTLAGLPLILSTGPGAEGRHAIGWVIFGGLGIALFESIESVDPTALIGLPLIWLAGALRRADFALP